MLCAVIASNVLKTQTFYRSFFVQFFRTRGHVYDRTAIRECTVLITLIEQAIKIPLWWNEKPSVDSWNCTEV